MKRTAYNALKNQKLKMLQWEQVKRNLYQSEHRKEVTLENEKVERNICYILNRQNEICYSEKRQKEIHVTH